MIGVVLDSPSDSRVLIHGATSVPYMPAFSGNPRLRLDVATNTLIARRHDRTSPLLRTCRYDTRRGGRGRQGYKMMTLIPT